MLVRANSLYFTSGYVGYLVVWILDTIQRCALASGHLATHLQTFVSGALELLNDRRGEGRGGAQSPIGWMAVPALLHSTAHDRFSQARTLPAHLPARLPAGFCHARGWSAPAACCAWGCRRCRHTSASPEACTW